MHRRPYILACAGEISGDKLLGISLRCLKKLWGEVDIRGLGGPISQKEGLQEIHPFKDLSVNGILDVILALPRLILALRAMQKALINHSRKPDLLLLCDYPGMNLRLAQLAQRLKIPTLFIAPPQVWAYKNPEKKLLKLRPILKDAVLIPLFPFEVPALERHFSKVLQGNPFSNSFSQSSPFSDPPTETNPNQSNATRLLFCPGSRRGPRRRALSTWITRMCRDRNHPLFPWRDLSGVTVLVPKEDILATQGWLFNQQRRTGTLPLGDWIVESDLSIAAPKCRQALCQMGTLTLELAILGMPVFAFGLLDSLSWIWAKNRIRPGPYALPNQLVNVAFQKRRDNVTPIMPEWVGTIRHLLKANPEDLYPLPHFFKNIGNREQIQSQLRSAIGTKTLENALEMAISQYFRLPKVF